MGRVMGGALASGGGGLGARAAGLARMMGTLRKVRSEPQPGSRGDPLVIARQRLRHQDQHPPARGVAARRWTHPRLTDVETT